MARIRSLKPEFWDDRKLARATSRDARMLYMGMWNQADEHGRLNGDALWLKGRIFPYDDDIDTAVIAVLVKDLVAAGRIVAYEVDGDPYLYLPMLEKHQRLETKVASRHPDPPAQSDPGESASHADKSAYPQDDARIGPDRPDAEKSASDADDDALLYGSGIRDQGAGGAHAEARADPPLDSVEPPPEFCSRHPRGTEKPCGPCKTARLRFAAWDKSEAGRAAARQRELEQARTNCDDCQGTNWIVNPDDGSSRKCDHRRTA